MSGDTPPELRKEGDDRLQFDCSCGKRYTVRDADNDIGAELEVERWKPDDEPGDPGDPGPGEGGGDPPAEEAGGNPGPGCPPEETRPEETHHGARTLLGAF